MYLDNRTAAHVLALFPHLRLAEMVVLLEEMGFKKEIQVGYSPKILKWFYGRLNFGIVLCDKIAFNVFLDS